MRRNVHMKKITIMILAIIGQSTIFNAAYLAAYTQYCPFGTQICPDPRLGGQSVAQTARNQCKWKDELPLKDTHGKQLTYAYTTETNAQVVEYTTGNTTPAKATCYVYLTSDDIEQIKKFIGSFDRYSTISALLKERLKQAGGSNVGILPGEKEEFRYMAAVLVLQDFMRILPGTISTQRFDPELGKTHESKEVSIVQALDELQKIEIHYGT